MYPTFKPPLYKKVANMYALKPVDPDDHRYAGVTKLVILELEEDLEGITPLPLGTFNEKLPVMGISTAMPTLLGIPNVREKSRHTFSYERLTTKPCGILETKVMLPKTVNISNILETTFKGGSADSVPNSSTTFADGSSSLFCSGDSGAPLLQDGIVVSVCESWLISGSITHHVISNRSAGVAQHIDRIRSIVPDVIFIVSDGSAAVSNNDVTPAVSDGSAAASDSDVTPTTIPSADNPIQP